MVGKLIETSSPPAQARKSTSERKIVMGPVNFSDQPRQLVNELRRRGVDARLIEYRRNAAAGRFGYDSGEAVNFTAATRLQVQHSTITSLLDEGVDTFHLWYRSFLYGGPYEDFMGLDIPFLRLHGRNVVYRFTGEDLRRKSLHMERNPYSAHHNGYQSKLDESGQERYLDFLQEHVDRFIVQDIELHEFCPSAAIVPRALDLGAFAYVGVTPTEQPLVVHAPSNYEIKGTKFVRAAVETLRDEGLAFRYKEVTDLPHAEAISLFRQSDIIIDQLHIGWYGVLTVEGMALGKPVITYVRPDLMARHVPTVPILQANPDTITDVLRRTVKDYELRLDVGIKARRFAEEVHDVQKVTDNLIGIYDELPCRSPQGDFHKSFDYIRHQQEAAETKLRDLQSKVRQLDYLKHKLQERNVELAAARFELGKFRTRS